MQGPAGIRDHYCLRGTVSVFHRGVVDCSSLIVPRTLRELRKANDSENKLAKNGQNSLEPRYLYKIKMVLFCSLCS